MFKEKKMLTIDALREEYQYHSEKLGNICRQLNFSGIAVVWILSSGKVNAIVESWLLFFVALFIIFSFTSELMQYSYSTILSASYARFKENKFKSEKLSRATDFEWSKYWNWPKIICLWLKIIWTILAYICLIIYVIKFKFS